MFSYLVLVKQYPFVSILLTQIEHIVTTLENLELQSLVKESCRTDSALFDTAERYGSHIKTALGVSKRPSYFREQLIFNYQGFNTNVHISRDTYSLGGVRQNKCFKIY